MSVLVTVLTLVCLGMAAWLRAAGTAVTRIPRADALRDSAEQKSGAAIVARLLEDRESINPAVSVVAVALLVISAVLGTALVASDVGLATGVGYALAVGLSVFFVGDLVPRQVGRHRIRAIAYRSAGLLAVAMRLGGWANDLLPEPESPEPGREPTTASEEADEQERELIDSVLEFGGTLVREVMTPRPDMITVPVTATVDELVAIAAREGFSRVPITDNGDVVGLVIMKDLLPFLTDGQRPASLKEVMRPVEFVPEAKLASSLLAEMQSRRVHQMIVVDEYGDVAGLVTIEDLIEELVGEISDETDEDESLIVTRADGGWDVDARLSVEDLAEVAGVELPEVEWDTVGGLVLGLAERIPADGEHFDLGALRFTVTKMQGRRISTVMVTASNTVDTR
ncbi:MAG TPA: hemolysin family protein [Acidimicrobiia bacterium]|nr:hemolysin family protein [Acidimicrobiia bacterium]